MIETTNKINDVDWNFPNSGKTDSLSNIHPYPAKFIPDIPKNLIRLFPPPKGSSIFDPFCGSGTTLVEAQKAGYNSIGVDLNPIACLISKIKTSPLPKNLEQIAIDVIEKSRKENINLDLPEIPNLDHWFKKEIQIEVSKLVYEIHNTDNPAREFLLLALSSILVRISNQDSDTRYAAIEKNLDKESVYKNFKNSISRIIKVKKGQIELPKSLIINKNILKTNVIDIPNKIGLAITSPPYPNAYEYWLYHKYRMFWLGYDPIKVKKDEIGARAHYFKKNPPTNEDFFNQMKYVLQLMWDGLIPNGKACFVIGRSKIHGKIVNNAEIISNAANQVGFKQIAKLERVIAPSRKSFNLSHGKIKIEHILVFNKKNTL